MNKFKYIDILIVVLIIMCVAMVACNENQDSVQQPDPKQSPDTPFTDNSTGHLQGLNDSNSGISLADALPSNDLADTAKTSEASEIMPVVKGLKCVLGANEAVASWDNTLKAYDTSSKVGYRYFWDAGYFDETQYRHLEIGDIDLSKNSVETKIIMNENEDIGNVTIGVQGFVGEIFGETSEMLCK